MIIRACRLFKEKFDIDKRIRSLFASISRPRLVRAHGRRGGAGFGMEAKPRFRSTQWSAHPSLCGAPIFFFASFCDRMDHE